MDDLEQRLREIARLAKGLGAADQFQTQVHIDLPPPRDGELQDIKRELAKIAVQIERYLAR